MSAEMDNSKFQIITTSDGSRSIYLPGLDETYHSRHGAIQEAEHVFIEKGLRHLLQQEKKELSLLEVGFGTGLNALLSFLEADKIRLPNLDYTGLELFPLPIEVMKAMQYADAIVQEHSQEVYTAICNADWGVKTLITPHSTITKLKGDIHSTSFYNEQFDLVYFDAFGFRAQEDMWRTSVFEKLYTAIKPNGVLVTYASKGVVRRSMLSVGFSVEKLPGPKGKREMLRATKNR